MVFLTLVHDNISVYLASSTPLILNLHQLAVPWMNRCWLRRNTPATFSSAGSGFSKITYSLVNMFNRTVWKKVVNNINLLRI